MTDSMLPILRQMRDADGDRERAKLLLACPDSVILNYCSTLDHICEKARFAAGQDFIRLRFANLLAVRGADGNLPIPVAHHFEDFRAGFAHFANGGGRA